MKSKMLTIFVVIVCVLFIANLVQAFAHLSGQTTLDQQRQDFVDGCKYYAGGAPDTSTSPWRCVKP